MRRRQRSLPPSSPVQVEGRAAMLGLLAAVPQPQVAQPRLGAGQRLRVRQQVLGEDGGEVLGGRRDAPASGAGRRLPAAGAGAGCARSQRVDQALPREVPVEELVDAPVRRLLADEGLHLVGEALACRSGGSAARPARTASMKNCSPAGKLIDSALKNARAKGVAAIPAARDRSLEVDEQAADGQCRHRCELLGCRHLQTAARSADPPAGVAEHAHPRAGARRASPGVQLICTLRNTRSGCGISAVKRPSAVVTAVRPPGLPLGLNG